MGHPLLFDPQQTGKKYKIKGEISPGLCYTVTGHKPYQPARSF